MTLPTPESLVTLPRVARDPTYQFCMARAIFLILPRGLAQGLLVILPIGFAIWDASDESPLTL